MPKRKIRLCKLGPRFIEHIHDSVVAVLWPGGDPVGKNDYRDFGLIDSATARPFHSPFGIEPYPSVPEKAAALFHSLNANHAFYNGNKRTAVVAFDSFLLANGYYCLLLNPAMYALAEKTASYKKRGLTHDASYREILDEIGPTTVRLETIRQAGTIELHRQLLDAKKAIRRSPLNELVDP